DGDHFAHHPTADVPGAQFGVEKVFAQLITDHRRIRRTTSSPSDSDSIAPQKVHILFPHISEARDVAMTGVASARTLIRKTFIGRVGLSTIVVPGDVLAQQAAVV